MNIQLIEVKTIETENLGKLSFFESNRDIPFEVRRVYYITNVPKNGKRGGHAHKNLRQILFCPYGSITIKLDDGKEKEEVILDNPNKGLVLTSKIWREMLWNIENSVLCVGAELYYDESDYIRDYNEFIESVEKSS